MGKNQVIRKCLNGHLENNTGYMHKRLMSFLQANPSSTLSTIYFFIAVLMTTYEIKIVEKTVEKIIL